MEKLMEILTEVNETIDFENETSLIDDDIIDSLDLMQIISEIEENFKVEIGMERIIPENFNSAEAMWRLIQELQNE